MSAHAAADQPRFDPLLRGISLPFATSLHVSGFTVSIATNDQRVQRIAHEAWGDCPARFDRLPLEVRVIVQHQGPVAADPVFRSQGTLLTVVSDRHNFGVADLNRGAGFLEVSDRTVGQKDRFRWFFLESLVYTMLAHDAATPLHAACVERAGKGYLLCGPSGAGKSTLAFSCARRGWSFVSDDASFLVAGRGGYTIAGRPRSARLRGDAARWVDGLEATAARPHPNGKEAIELTLADFPEMRCSAFCTPGALVRLRRGARDNRITRVAPEPVVAELLDTIPWLGEEVRQRHAREIAAVAGRGVWHLEYDSPDSAVRLLEELAAHHD